MLKKISALLLALVMVLSLCAGAMAAEETPTTTLNDNGEQGAFKSPDSPESQGKTLILEKEITAYNYNETEINAPTISYTYTIAKATVADGTTITDNANKHAEGAGAVTVPVKEGVGNPTIANNGVVAWTCAETMSADSDGEANKKTISIDFSNVVFSGPGVYRYVITEKLTGTSDTYAMSGVTETAVGSNPGSHSRFIDVYVRPASPTPEGKTDTDPEYWDIYGFTCFYNNKSITDADKGNNAVKSTGFVSGTTDGSTESKADSYYTYNLTLNKTVRKDDYSAKNVAFPFTVIFTNNDVTKNIDIIGKVEEATVTDWTDPAAGALSSTKGVVKIKSGGQVKYIGIPCGTSVEVYETNVATGITYKVDTKVTTSTGVAQINDPSVTWSTAPNDAVAQGDTKEAYQSTKATITTTANADDDTAYTIAITNELVTISPTGVALRVAPYVLILFAGMALLLVSRRRKAVVEE